MINPVTEEIAHGRKPVTPGVSVSDRWTWWMRCTWRRRHSQRLYAATGDKKYLDFGPEYRYTYDTLWDPEEHLFFRDSTYFDTKTPAGRIRSGVAAMAGCTADCASCLEWLPTDHPTRGFYENLFKEMTDAVLSAQQSDGLWRPSLLDPDQIPVGETSGMASSCSAGLGREYGLLDRDQHWPAIMRGWAGLMTRVKANGYVGYVQRIGSAPDSLTRDSGQDYGTGAFLLAGSEVLRALGGASEVPPSTLLAEAEARLADDQAHAHLPVWSPSARTTWPGRTIRSPFASTARRCVRVRRTAELTCGARASPTPSSIPGMRRIAQPA